MKYFALIVTLFIISQVDAKQKYYKWTDAEGNTHYSEEKPENTQISEINVNTKQPTVKAVVKKDNNGDDGKANTEQTPEQLAIDKYNKEEKKKAKKVQDRENCKVAKMNLQTLQNTVRVKRKNPATGEYIRMDDKARVEMMKNAKKSIRELCK